MEWVLADEVQGVVMRGRLGAGVGAGGGGGGGNVTATGSVVGATMATKTQSVSIVGVEELDSS